MDFSDDVSVQEDSIAECETEAIEISRLTPSTDLKDIGRWVSWTVSSAKPGNGVCNLRDGSIETFWQSDGPQPHCIEMQLVRRSFVSELWFYVDEKMDESYTPSRVVVKAGDDLFNLWQVNRIELQRPRGWTCVSMEPPEGGGSREAGYVKVRYVTLSILSSHQAGKDTHIRQIKLLGPKQNDTIARQHPSSFIERESFLDGLDQEEYAEFMLRLEEELLFSIRADEIRCEEMEAFELAGMDDMVSEVIGMSLSEVCPLCPFCLVKRLTSVPQGFMCECGGRIACSTTYPESAQMLSNVLEKVYTTHSYTKCNGVPRALYKNNVLGIHCSQCSQMYPL